MVAFLPRQNLGSSRTFTGASYHFFKASAYLLLYNLMFIVPLALVFVLALCGKESSTFNNWLKKHLGLTKLLLCGVFLGLLLLLLFNM